MPEKCFDSWHVLVTAVIVWIKDFRTKGKPLPYVSMLRMVIQPAAISTVILMRNYQRVPFKHLIILILFYTVLNGLLINIDNNVYNCLDIRNNPESYTSANNHLVSTTCCTEDIFKSLFFKKVPLLKWNQIII